MGGMTTPTRNDPYSRTEGYAPIASYGVLGDGRCVALVAGDGRVDWWPIPALDSPPACAAILDPATGGFFSLAPIGDFELERAYVKDTNVLQVTYRGEHGTALVTDALNTGISGPLPWTELARRVEVLQGHVDFEWRFEPGDRFASARPWFAAHGDVPIAHLGDQTIALVLEGATSLEVGHGYARGRIGGKAGTRGLIAAVASDDEPTFVPDASSIHDRIDRTVEGWRRWVSQIGYDGPHRDAVVRSALALKVLANEKSGAIAAAATTSLPERIGGPKNWDYRYAWVRDSSFTLDALIGLQLSEEVQACTAWLLHALGRTAPQLHVFYSLDGSVADEQEELDAPGYRASAPVRSGNSASGQRQLGVYGDLFDTILRYVRAGHYLDGDTRELMSGLADQCCDQWMSKDSGIWELGDLEHYTISKIGCWVALDRAVSLAELGQLPVEHADRWRGEARLIRRFVEEHCWSDKHRAYSFYAGTDELDAAVLLAGRTGFDRGARLAATIEAVIRELGDGPCIYRYSGMPSEEGAFIACSFWVADALVFTGQLDRAREWMDQAVALTSELGLLSEQIDPRTREMLGNTPQGLSHLALINAAHDLRRASASH